MAVIRVNKTSNYTIMSNYHFKEKKMSLKAKGLLSMMLSLPDDWDYSIAGLATLSKDGKDSVMSALKELEQFGYLTRTRIVNKQGHFKGYDYDIYEMPQILPPNSENPKTEEPKEEQPKEEEPKAEKTCQLNTNVLTTNSLKTYDQDILYKSEPNDFVKELIQNGYIEKNDPSIQEYNDYMEEVVKDHGQEVAKNCLIYFMQNKKDVDRHGQPIFNKFAYFKESIEFGILKISPYFKPKRIPSNIYNWLEQKA